MSTRVRCPLARECAAGVAGRPAQPVVARLALPIDILAFR